jgi:hypothetical protein
MDTAFYTAGFLAITLLAFLALKPFDGRLTVGFGLLFVAYVVLDDFITGLPYTAEIFDLNPAQWNWAGKVYSILLSAAVIAGLGMSARATGLVLPRRNVKAGIVALVLLIPLGVVLALVFEPELPTAETLAFQLLMPGLAEELAFRGIAPALLLGLIRGKSPGPETPWVVVCIAAVPRSAWRRRCGRSAEGSPTAGCASRPAACCSRCWLTASRTSLFTSRRW